MNPASRCPHARPGPPDRRLDHLVRLGLAASDGTADPAADTARAALVETAAIAAALFRMPMCLISVVDESAQHVVASHGIEPTSIPRGDSLCARSVDANTTVVLPDASRDDRSAGNTFVQGDFGLRFYAGTPLRTREGQPLGTICLIDRRPRDDFDPTAVLALERLAAQLSGQLERRRDELAQLAERDLLAAGPMAAVVWRPTPTWPICYHSANLAHVFGSALARLLLGGTPIDTLVHPLDRAEFNVSMRCLGRLPGQAAEFSFRVIEPAGRIRWLRQSCLSQPGPEAGTTVVRAYLTDESRQKRTEASLVALKDRLSIAMESARLGTFDLRVDAGERLVDSRAAEIVGMRLDEAETDIDTWLERVHPFDRPSIARLLSPGGQGGSGDTRTAEYRIRHRDGGYVWVQSYGKVVERSEDGGARRVIGTLLDITERKREETTRNRQRQLLGVLNRAQAGFLLTHDLHEACSDLFEPLLRLTESQFGFIGMVRDHPDGHRSLLVPAISDLSWDEGSRRLFERHYDRDAGLEFHDLDNLFGHAVTHGEVVIANDPARHPSARGLPAGHPPLDNFLGLPIRFNDRVLGMIGLANCLEGYDQALVELLEPLVATLGALVHARELAEARRRAEAELERRATTDELTQLVNRRAFEEAAKLAVARAGRHGRPLVLAVLDLDHFKRINDGHGHAAGDAVLRQFAALTSATLRDTDLVGRQGGEEFAVLMHDVDIDAACLAVDRLREVVEQAEVPWQGGTLRFTMSAGVARVAPGPAGAPASAALDEAFAAADRALYGAKHAGRNRVLVAGDDVAAVEVAAAQAS